jgi:hypothetical protein
MPQFQLRSEMPASADAGFRWHARPGALRRMTPPWEKVGGIEHGDIAAGQRAILEVRTPLGRNRWVSELFDVDPPRQFCDRQLEGPFARWEHAHRFEPADNDRFIMDDQIDYTLPMGPIGALLGGRMVRRRLGRMFRFRHARLRQDLLRHQPWADRVPMRVAITGSSGLIGSRLSDFLRSGGHEVIPIVRHAPEPGTRQVQWNVTGGTIDSAGLEGVDAVVHLAGENIAAGRWNDAQKQRIRDSREKGTRLLSETLAKLNDPPKMLICASAVGYYGDRGDELLTEDAPPGEGFLPEVAMAWERAAEAARDAGLRVVHMRIGVVVAGDGGALGRMLTPFKLGLGGRIGTGRQWMSWIAIEDLVGAMHFAMMNDKMAGAFNAVAPQSVRNVEFVRTLGRVLRRPTIAPLPGFMVKLLMGQMGQDLLLAGTRADGGKLADAGFGFLLPDLEDAMRFELGRMREDAS